MDSMAGLMELKLGRFWVCVIAETLGTALLVAISCGACYPITFKNVLYDPDILHQSFAAGISVATVIWMIAHVSGGHINPAVTAGCLAARRISFPRAILYVLGQCLGATMGAFALQSLSPSGWPWQGADVIPDAQNQHNISAVTFKMDIRTPVPGDNVPFLQVVAIESMISFVLVVTVFASSDETRTGWDASGPLAVGLAITMGHLWAIPLTGAATNPALVFGTAVISNTWKEHSAYWIGPVAGGVLGALLYDLFIAANATSEKLKSFFTEYNYDDKNFDEHGRRRYQNVFRQAGQYLIDNEDLELPNVAPGRRGQAS